MGGCCAKAIEEYYRDTVVDMRNHPDRMAIEIHFRSGRAMVMDEYAIQDLCRKQQYQGRRYEWQVSPMSMSPGDMYSLPVDYQAQFRDYAVNSYRADYAMRVAPRARCTKCGEEHETKLDHHGFCQKQATKFWAKVRRLYWHRYLKESV